MKYLMIMGLLAVAACSSETCTPRANVEVSDQLSAGDKTGLPAFLQRPECYYWSSFYHAADMLFKDGRKDEALKWLIVGEIRARVAAGLDPDASRNNAIMVAFNQGIGQPIKAYAKRDKENWLAQIDAALAWDVAHPLKPDPMLVTGSPEVEIDAKNFEEVYGLVRQGLRGMRDQIARTDAKKLKPASGKIDFKR